MMNIVASKISFLSIFLCLWGGISISHATLPEYSSLASILERSADIEVVSSTPHVSKARKDWNFIVYFAANNNLHRFALENIKQMAKIGSTGNVNVIIQLDELGDKSMNRYYVDKGRLVNIHHESNTIASISGTRESLDEFLTWTFKNYPANHQCLVLWNHGSGIKDPNIWGKFFLTHRDDLFVKNQTTGLYELNRKLSRQYSRIQDLKTFEFMFNRGISFNDTFETYLTNQDLQIVLNQVCTSALHGKKIDIICMDACLMAMVEIASQIKESVNYLVASQELEPGAGYDYSLVLSSLEKGTLSPDLFAKSIVQAYGLQYYSWYADYTQSALKVGKIADLEMNFSNLVGQLSALCKTSHKQLCVKLLSNVRMNGRKTLEFDDPDYIDLGILYSSLHEECLTNKMFAKMGQSLKNIQDILVEGLSLIEDIVIANVAGSNLNKATGISIFFPTRSIDASYKKTTFNNVTKWSDMLTVFLKEKGH